MKLLILGGTKFLGRHLVNAAAARGHEITLFNRGQTNPSLFQKIQQLRGDRAGDLRSLESGRWDCVIDTSGQVFRDVDAVAKLLASLVDHYTFVSSVSAYADFSRIGIDESAPVATLPVGKLENINDAETYGARKFLCEQAAEKRMPGKVLIVRPGLIIGPFDHTGRFAYWIRRVAQGGEVLAPENPSLPLQLIDARDLADWIIRMSERKQTGVFNATGPKEPLTFGHMLDVCKTVTGSRASFKWVAGKFLLHHRVEPFSDLPFWIPESDRSYAGHYHIDSDRAFRSGLVCRPIEETIRDFFRWDCEPKSIDSHENRSGLAPEREQRLLEALKASR